MTIAKQQEHLKQERERVSDRLARFEENSKNSEPDKPQSEILDRIAVLKSHDSILAQHRSKLNDLENASLQLKEAEQSLNALKEYEPAEKKPYSFLTLEFHRDSLELETLDEELIGNELESVRRLVQNDELDLKAKQKALSSKLKTLEDSNSFAPSKAILELEVAKAKLAFHQTQYDLLKTRQATSRAIQKQWKSKLAVLEKGARFSADDREQKIEQLKVQSSRMIERKREAEYQVDRLLVLESVAHGSDLKQSQLSAAIKQINVSVEIYQIFAAWFGQVADNLTKAESLWKFRYELENSSKIGLTTLREGQSDLVDVLEEIDALFTALRNKRESVRNQMEKDAIEVSQEQELQDVRQAREEALRFMDVASASIANQLQSLKLPLSRFRKDLRNQISKSTSIWNMNPKDFLRSFFAYEVAEVDDKSITLSRAIFLVVLIALGIYASYIVSKFVGKYVFPWLGVKPGVAIAFRSIFRYLFCIAFAVVAFKLLEVPLTAFAFLGGAAAIAVGFGSQDVMNNFMSGLILLTEQPIRVGDVILLSENQCVVTHIGLRSTRLKNYQNHELIVPNTLLIEKLVTNLTLSDNLLRVVVPLVVDRTEPINESMQRIIQALKKEDRVHQAKEPIVLLKEVDTYYLTFEVHFTIEFTDPMESLAAQSNILAVIGKLFPSKPASSSSEEATEGVEDMKQEAPLLSASAGKLSRTQLEKEIKTLQGILVTKK